MYVLHGSSRLNASLVEKNEFCGGGNLGRAGQERGGLPPRGAGLYEKRPSILHLTCGIIRILNSQIVAGAALRERLAVGRHLWIDITTISAVCATHAALCAKNIGGGAAWARSGEPEEDQVPRPDGSLRLAGLPPGHRVRVLGFAQKELSLLLKVWSHRKSYRCS